jgi:hypothetical protein
MVSGSRTIADFQPAIGGPNCKAASLCAALTRRRRWRGTSKSGESL